MNLTVTEAAELIGVSEANVYKAIKAGRLASEKIYNRLTVPLAAAEAYKQGVGVRNGFVKQKTRLQDEGAT